MALKVKIKKSVCFIIEGESDLSFLINNQLTIANFKTYSQKAYETVSSLHKKLKQLLSTESFIWQTTGSGLSSTYLLPADNIEKILSDISSKKDFIQQRSDSRIKSPLLLSKRTPITDFIFDCCFKQFQITLLSPPVIAKGIKKVLLKQIKLIKRLLVEFRKRKVICYVYVLDLRQIFRTKIRFLFKNMDDCSNHNTVLELKKTITLLIRTTFKHETNRYHKIFAGFA